MAYSLFADFRQSYDTIIRHSLYEAMKDLGIKSKLVRVVKTTLSGTHCRVRVVAVETQSFNEVNGLR